MKASGHLDFLPTNSNAHVRLNCIPTTFLASFVVPLSTLEDITQLFLLFSEPTCSLSCCSVSAIISRPQVCRCNKRGRHFPLRFLRNFALQHNFLCLSAGIKFTWACVRRRTSTRDRPSTVIVPRYTKTSAYLISSPSNLMSTSSLAPNPHHLCLLRLHPHSHVLLDILFNSFSTLVFLMCFLLLSQ